MANSYFLRKTTIFPLYYVYYEFLNALDSLGVVCYSSPIPCVMVKHDWEKLNAKSNLSNNPLYVNILRERSLFSPKKRNFFILTSADRSFWEWVGYSTAVIGGGLLWNLYHIGIHSLTSLWMWIPTSLLWPKWRWRFVGPIRFGLDVVICCFPDQVLMVSSTKVYWFTDLQVHFPGGGELLFRSLWSYHYILITFKWFFLNFNSLDSVGPKSVLNKYLLNNQWWTNTFKMRPIK